MSGLFLNFYRVEIPTKIVSVDSLEYSPYSTKEAFYTLKKNFPDHSFYRDGDKILIWNKTSDSENPHNTTPISIDLKNKAKVLSKAFELSVIDCIKVKLKNYRVFKNKHSNSWEIVSPNDILKGTIEGLTVNRIVHFAPCFFFKEDKLLLGFSLSTSLKNSFTWNKAEFDKYGIDIKGLKGDESKIFANRQSLKRFLETKGVTSQYDKTVNEENKNSKCFTVLDNFYKWLDKNKAVILLPFGLSITTISKKYLPFENELIKSETINKPQRYFYSNRKNIDRLRFYDEMVRKYHPYSLELFQNKEITFGIICPKEFQGETEGFIKKMVE